MAALVTLQEATTHLRLKDELDDAKERKLRSTIEAVTSAVEARVGWVARRPETFTLEAGATLLPGSQVLSVESGTILRTGAAVDVSTMRVEHGIISRPDGGALPGEAWQVTVLVGRDPIPPEIREGALEIIREAWSASQKGAGTDPTSRPYLISYGAAAYFEGDEELLGFA